MYSGSEETNQLVVYDSKRLNLDSLWLIGLEVCIY